MTAATKGQNRAEHANANCFIKLFWNTLLEGNRNATDGTLECGTQFHCQNFQMRLCQKTPVKTNNDSRQPKSLND